MTCSRTCRAWSANRPAARALVGGLERVQVGGQRRLRVDDEVLASGDPHDEIGAQRAVLGRRRRLCHVVAVLEHSGVLDDVAQLRLAPAPADVRCAQRVRETSGTLGERRDLRPQGAVGLLPDPLDAAELDVHPLQRVRERPHVTREVRLGQLEEARAVRVQRLRRERLDRSLEPLVERTALDGELRLGARERALELDDLLGASPALEERRAYREEDGERSDRQTDEEGDDDHRVDER